MGENSGTDNTSFVTMPTTIFVPVTFVSSSQVKQAEPPRMEPCAVCGGASSGYHFGVLSCEACKVFFRRSLQKNPQYECKKEKKCVIQPGRGNSCSYCRLRKCQALGMTNDWVAEKGRYTLEKRAECIKRSRDLERKQKELEEQRTREATEYTQKLEAICERLQELQKKHNYFTQEFKDSIPILQKEYVKTEAYKRNVLGLHPIPHEVHKEVFKSTGIDLDDHRKDIFYHMSQSNSLLQLYVEHVKEMPCFKEISLPDQIHLTKYAYLDWSMLEIPWAYDTELQLVTCPCCSKTYDREHLIVEYGEDYVNEIFPIIRILKKTNMSTEEVQFAKAIVLYSPDRIKEHLEDRELIEEKQLLMADAFQFYLRRNYSQPNRFAHIIQALTELRGVTHLTEKVWPQQQQKYDDIEIPQLLDEMISHFALDQPVDLSDEKCAIM